MNDDDEPLDYGGWWCFAFPVDLTDDYPLPVFVRGDDVCFGLRYCGGHLVAVNGIGVWHQDFAYKNGPVALFYENRNIPVVLSVSRPDYDAAALRKRLIERTLRFASAFKYDTATAVLDGVEAFLDGPDALVGRARRRAPRPRSRPLRRRAIECARRGATIRPALATATSSTSDPVASCVR